MSAGTLYRRSFLTGLAGFAALQFYNNSEQADHYILGGKLIGQTGNESFDVKLGN